MYNEKKGKPNLKGNKIKNNSMNIDIQQLRDVIYRLKREKIIKLQKDIARDTGYDVTTVSDILNEKQVLSEKFIIAFSRAYNLNPENLNQVILKSEFMKADDRNDAITMEEIRTGFQTMYTALLHQMDRTNEIALRLTDVIKEKEREHTITLEIVRDNAEVIKQNAIIVEKLSDVIKDNIGEGKLKKVLGKVS